MALYERLNSVTMAVFQDEERSQDATNAIDRALARAWFEHHGDVAFDAAVVAGAHRVLSEEGRREVILSGFDVGKANQMTQTLAHHVLDSREVGDLISVMIMDAAEALEPILIETSARSAHAAASCLEQFTRETFPASLAQLHGQYLAQGSDSISDRQDTGIVVSERDLVMAHRFAAAGVGTVVATQIIARIAPLILSKFAAGVIAATVPLVGWTIGAVLLVTDVIVNREGAVGLAKNALMSAEYKKDFRDQLRESILEEMRAQAAEIASEVAKGAYWGFQEFLRQWKRVIFWSENNEYFFNFLEHVNVREMDKLAELVGILERTLEATEMHNLINHGGLERLLGMRRESYAIIETSDDPNELLEWSDLAGETVLLQVVKSELYRVSDPSQFDSRTQLQRVLNLEMPLSDVRSVLMLGPHMNVLLELPAEDARTIVAQSRQHNDLVWLLPFLSAMSSRQINLTIDRIIHSPVVLRKLESEHTRNALINSSDFAGYLDHMSQPAGFSAELLFKKHGGILFGAVVAVVALLLMWKIGKRSRELAQRKGRKRLRYTS